MLYLFLYFFLGPDPLKRGMTAKMGIGIPDPDPVGDLGIVRIQEIERIPDPVPDREVLWKMETKNNNLLLFSERKKQQQNNHLWILTSRRKKRTALFSFVLLHFTSALPHKMKIITRLKSISNKKSPIWSLICAQKLDIYPSF